MEVKEPVEMQWRVRPAKLHKTKAIWASIFIVAVGLAIASSGILLGIALVGVLVGTQAIFFFTTAYSIDEKGLVAKFPLRKKQYSWEQVRRVKFFKEACILFTRKKPSNLDGWTGITVMYGDNRDEVIRSIKSHLLEGTAT
ncbi:MAG: hypothetical protein H8E86_08130 [Planctomycetes bacterium]|nr:hypothetical protein [Planctomycetota bacterium]